MNQKTISIIVPVFNEAENILLLYKALRDAWRPLQYTPELIFVNDGSTDTSAEVLESLAAADSLVKYIELSRNFGKEMATTAGLHEATGDAVLLLDADLQHPPSLIPQFVEMWEAGAEVVIGVRTATINESFIKKWGSRIFYRIIRVISETHFEHGETDFRLLDRAVVDAFKAFPEHQRMTRSLINWLGFKREKIYFVAPDRQWGTPQYSIIKLTRLAINSFLSHSLLPLRLAGYLGVFITIVSSLLGLVVVVEKYFLNDPLGWGVTGSAQLAILIVFLVGIVLASLGIIGLYVGAIHGETINRPLYVVRKRNY